jgi:hypothetical protein
MSPRRVSDHPAWDWLGWVGIFLALFAFAGKWVGKLSGSDFWAALVFAALLVRPDKLVDLVRAWRARRSQALPTVPDDGSPGA